ncbi:uncharacterized protein BX663DRAFT_511398 [Cokeromyces recurvatus]|uniref:uncharacterized protein n=1 Tax=Cokeromyces recurvatus TaxID=90255 RepID=UPI00221FB85C|nr:uncharacterized protein BX663DRAFT_511398 [Cokeromyces recurvatus]KAI7902538.1 hypothetical protein BX663DRAFT_511398 [Cokeromyces recurvatus]
MSIHPLFFFFFLSFSNTFHLSCLFITPPFLFSLYIYIVFSSNFVYIKYISSFITITKS